MNRLMMSMAMRTLFVLMAGMIWGGIYLTGFDKVHWLLYVPGAALAFAGITGICPGALITRTLFPEK